MFLFYDPVPPPGFASDYCVFGIHFDPLLSQEKNRRKLHLVYIYIKNIDYNCTLQVRI